MNMPFKPGAIQGRDAFAAYLCDEASLGALRPLLAEWDWPLEKCQRGGLREAVQMLSIASSPKILMVDLSESGDPLSDINELAEVCEPGTIVIAAGQLNDVRLYRELLASGIHDYLLKPLSPGHLRDTLANARAMFDAPRPDAADRQHCAAAVIGTRGGCGASTIAASLAWLFSTEQQLPTALFDLDVHFGTGALTLDVEPGRGLTDAIDNPQRIDGLFIERAMIRANDHLSVLSAEAPINSPLLTDGNAFVQLQDELGAAFDMAVIDLPRHMLIAFPQVVAKAGVVLLVTELTLAGARDTIRVLSWFAAHCPAAHLLVVANKVAAVPEIARKDFETSIERALDFVIPYEAKSATNAARLGQTFAQANRSTAAGAALRELAARVHALGRPDHAELTPAAGKSRKFDLKSILAKKGKGVAAA